MSFGQSVKSVLSQYATFTGRARRSEYWWFTLFNYLVSIPGAIIFAIAYFSEVVPLLESADAQGNVTSEAVNNVNLGALFGAYVPALLVGLFLFLPGLAVVVRRLHDTGRSGWWYLISLVPFGNYVLLVFMFFDSQPHGNQYGPDPKAAERYFRDYPSQGYAQPAQLGYPTQPGYAPQPGYPTAPPPYGAQPGYPTAPPPYGAQPGYPTAPAGGGDPFATPSA